MRLPDLSSRHRNPAAAVGIRFPLLMPRPSLTVVIPAHNEAAHLRATIDALVDALAFSGFDAELVLVDDGSTDGSADAARSAAAARIPLRVLTQPNRGRLEARRAGVEAAAADLVMLLDARVRLHPGALCFVKARVGRGEDVWNGHVLIETEDDLGVFWRLLAELAWRDYFDRPRTTSFGAEEFDRFPKGTTCFVAPRGLLLWAFGQFRSRYRDARLANDDTPILRALAGRRRIGISPQFACVYTPRTTAVRFFRHAMHRGTAFLDGHGTLDSRFFPAVAAFFPASAALLAAALRRPLLAPAALGACGVAAAAYGSYAGRSWREIRALAIVAPPYALGHGLGMWRGAFELVRGRLAA
jgi:glycosyltransferase involved in cell wall biosynthesis